MKIDWKAAGCATIGLILTLAIYGAIAIIVRTGYGMHLVIVSIISAIWLVMYAFNKIENDERRDRGMR